MYNNNNNIKMENTITFSVKFVVGLHLLKYNFSCKCESGRGCRNCINLSSSKIKFTLEKNHYFYM